MVLENMLKAKEHIRGKLPYLYGIFVTLTRFKPIPMRIETAEGEVIDKALLAFFHRQRAVFRQRHPYHAAEQNGRRSYLIFW